MQTAIPCTVMRGGTSRGLYFSAADLPADPALRDRVLLAAMGSPDLRQIDGRFWSAIRQEEQQD